MALALLACLALIGWIQRPDGRLHVHVFAVPGDAILVQMPDGGFILIDGGSDPAALAVQLGRHMPFWQRKLTAVILTGTNHRRLPGQVGALARYHAEMALAVPDLGTRGTAGEWRRLLSEAQTPLYPLRAGQRLRFGGAGVSVLAVNPGDEGGAVLLVHYGATRILVHTGGNAGDAGAQLNRPDLLIYPWQRSTDTALLAQMKPRAIAFTTAYEAPEPALLTYAERHRAAPQLFHPALDGTITLISDGRRAWSESEK
ncbi:MAG: hypothetical protein HC822_19330 [Oscillochloris sp.]|nr:hypothetical protein [Oscillochloris sp.]